jgi:hypothetical protein
MNRLTIAMNRITPLFTATLLVAALAAAGCDSANDIHVYDAPKGPRAVSGGQPPAPAPQQHTHAAAAPVEWTLPAGWTAQPGSSMRFATIIMPSEGDQPPVEMRVTPLAPAAGDVQANVDRWAVQIGLPPVPPSELVSVARPTTIGDHAGHLVSLVNQPDADGPAMQILAAMVTTEDRVWFFMIIDEQQRIEPHVDAFNQFVASITFPGHNHGPSQPTAAAPTPAAPPMAGGDMSSMPVRQGDDYRIEYQKPAAWKDDPAPSSMRAASFILEGEFDNGEVSVTHFPGNVGGLVANINRWRGQVNMEHIAAIDEQEFSRIQIDGRDGLAVDLIEPDMQEFQDEAKRMIVFLIPDVGGETWFFKMSGTYDVVEKNRDAFAAFCHSVKFKENNGG